MSMFKALQINPFTHTVNVIVMHETDQLAQFYKRMGCSTVDAIELENGDTLWIDDEGAIKENAHFHLEGVGVLAGIAVITGTAWDNEGDKLADCKSSSDATLEKIQWQSTAQSMN